MKAHPQILWHQGLFLHPQHFQAQDLAHQALLAPVYRHALPFFWGVGELVVDEAALAEGAVVLERGEFLFQDGSYCVLHENAVLEGRPLKGAWQEGESALPVYLGLRRWNDAGPNAALSDGGCFALATRMVSDPHPERMGDLHAGGPVAEVQRQSFLLKLFWEGELEQLGEYHLLPLLRLERAGQGARLADGFVPPLLSLGGSPWLAKTVAALRTVMAARLAELERRKIGERRGAALLTRGDLALTMAQYSLKRSLPRLAHLSECPSTHPWHIYLALSELIGELATFSEEEGSPLPPYDHAALARSFADARDRITELLGEILAAPDAVVPLIREGDLYAAQLQENHLSDRKRYFLSLRSESEPLVTLGALRGAVKVSSKDHLKVLVARALPGIGLTHAPVPPPGIPPRQHTLHLELEHPHEQWGMVISEKTLALYWPAPPADLEIELVVLDGCGTHMR